MGLALRPGDSHPSASERTPEGQGVPGQASASSGYSTGRVCRARLTGRKTDLTVSPAPVPHLPCGQRYGPGTMEQAGSPRAPPSHSLRRGARLAAAAQHHCPGRSQLILIPIRHLSCRPGWRPGRSTCPRPTAPHPPPLILHQWAPRHCFLGCLSSSQGLECACQGETGTPTA